MRKYASLQVLESWRVPAHANQDSIRKAAHRVAFDYQPRPGYLYVRSRMISSRCNDNHDEFPAPEIERAYQSFLGKPVFVNHHNSNHRRARGVIVAVALHRDRNRDSSPDTWVEGLMEVDAVRFPKLAQAILAKRVNRTSMGVDVELSKCSACGNQATSPAEYCKHLPALKGKKIRKRAANGQLREEIIREICHGLSFFENSLLVEDPADPTAYVLGDVDDRGLKMRASRAVTAARATPSTASPQRTVMRTTAPPLSYKPFMVEAASRPAYPNPADHPFLKANPVSPLHIVSAFGEATQNEREQGRRWYSDAHHVAKAIAGGDAYKGAGVLSAYSPQASWPDNLFNASNAFRKHAAGDPIPGPGSGAMGMHQKAAQRILSGEDNNSVLRAPKTNAFAHLIAHGGQSPEDKAKGHSRVVIDRHAMSVAIGRRTTKDDDLSFLSNPHYYEHVAQAYRDATHLINQMHDADYDAEHTQAITWGVQKRKNDEEQLATPSGKGRIQREKNSFSTWNEHARQHHTDLGPPGNMHLSTRQAYIDAIRTLAYGETTVPQQVDTLRTESCPVCGEQDVWSGQRCRVCGFVVPPSMFRDPDVEKAGEVRDQLDQDGEVNLPGEQQAAPADAGSNAVGAGAPVTGPGAQGSDPDADEQKVHPDQIAPDGVPAAQGPGSGGGVPDPETEQAQGEEQEADAESRMLNCPACGTQAEPGTPGAAEGQPCPACGKAPLEPVATEPLPQKGQRSAVPGGTVMGSAKEAAATASAQRMAQLERENASLRAGLSFLANLAGVGPELEAIRRQADLMNPGSPVPDPPEEAPSQTTEEALQAGSSHSDGGQQGSAPMGGGHSVDDVSRPGTTPGSVTNVPAVQTTTPITPGVEIPTAPATNLMDVTAPVTGTNPSEDGGVPIEQRRIETDVRINPNPLAAQGPGIGGMGNDGTAYPWIMGEQQGQQKTASAGDQAAVRTFASIRLAKMRKQAGLEQGEELSVAAGIERDAALSLPMIEREIDTLSRVASAAPSGPRRPMQRSATRAPSLSPPTAPMMAYASAASDSGDDSDLFLD